MDAGWSDLPELKTLGANLVLARRDRGYSQSQLARRCQLTQAQVSLFEAGKRLPSLDQFVRLARGLDVPLQRLLTGSDRPGVALKDLAVELRRLGAAALWVADATVPGAARRPEEVIARAVSGSDPDPRVIEMVPALLSWNRINPVLLRAYGIATRTTYRLAWLADIALTIERQKGFPGGCRKGPLERFLKSVGSPPGPAWDDLGRPAASPPKHPVCRRWRISCATEPGRFEERARELDEHRAAVGGRGQKDRSVRNHGRSAAIRGSRDGPGAGGPQDESGRGTPPAARVRRSPKGPGDGS